MTALDIAQISFMSVVVALGFALMIYTILKEKK